MSGIQGAFGFMRGGGAGYAYVAMSALTSDSVVQTTDWGATGTGTRWTGISPQSPGGQTQGVIGVVADGTFIVNTRYYSTNNGGSWTFWNGPANLRYFPPGLNGSIAYSTTSRRAFTFALKTSPKTGNNVCEPITITNTGAVISPTEFTISASPSGSNVSWAPAFNYFYFNSYGTSTNQYRYIDAAIPSTGASITIGNANNYRAGISSDGYPLLPVFISGVTYQLRKYTSADLSTFTNLGNISDGYASYAAQSPWLFYSVTNKYLVAAAQGGAVTIREATSANPQTLTVLSSFSIGSSSIQSVQISEDPTTGRLLASGVASFPVSKGGTLIDFYTYLSVDGGATWTNYLQAVMGASKNFK
jgi:hypothetical protein